MISGLRRKAHAQKGNRLPTGKHMVKMALNPVQKTFLREKHLLRSLFS